MTVCKKFVIRGKLVLIFVQLLCRHCVRRSSRYYFYALYGVTNAGIATATKATTKVAILFIPSLASAIMAGNLRKAQGHQIFDVEFRSPRPKT